MGQFKPMVKMTTTEPSVILKLKKGGKVAAKSDYKAMHEASESPSYEAAEHGKSPKKPSMSARRLAMNPQMYAKGGKSCAYVDKKLDKHKATPIKKAHVQKKAKGGSLTASMTNKTVEGNSKQFVNSKMVTAAKKNAAKTKVIRKAYGGNVSSGGSFNQFFSPPTASQQAAFNSMYTAPTAADQAAYNSMSTAPTAKDQEAFKSMYTAPTAADQASYNSMMKTDGQSGKSPVNMIYVPPTQDQQNAFQSMTSSAVGQSGNQPTPDQAYRKNMFTKGLGYASGGNVKNRSSKFNTTKVVTSRRDSGYEKYKDGGSAKKAYATGGNVVDDGKAEKMPRRPASRPVANDIQSGTFKKGGKVKNYAQGGSEEEIERSEVKSSGGPKGLLGAIFKKADDMKQGVGPSNKELARRYQETRMKGKRKASGGSC